MKLHITDIIFLRQKFIYSCESNNLFIYFFFHGKFHAFILKWLNLKLRAKLFIYFINH